MKSKFFILLILLFLFSNILFAESSDDKAETIEPPYFGYIFNTNDLLFDIDSYQGGIGFKLLIDNQNAFRFLLDGYYSNILNTFSFTLGTTFEGHFLPYDIISPYWGAFIDGGYSSQSVITDDENWITDNSIPFSIGAILGIEVFILEYLSVFAEYNLAAEFLIELTENSNNGKISKADPAYSAIIDTSIGNNSSLGLTIYFEKIIEIEK